MTYCTRRHTAYRTKYKPQCNRKKSAASSTQPVSSQNAASIKKRNKSKSNAIYRKKRFISCNLINVYNLISHIFSAVAPLVEKIKATSEDWETSLAFVLGREKLLDLLDKTTPNKGAGEFIQEVKKKAIAEFAKVSKESLVKCTENLSYKTLEELRTCPPLKVILPGKTSMVKYRDICSALIHKLSPHETLNGSYLSTIHWVTRMIEEFINNHPTLKNNPPTSIEIAWTVDYAKCGWTFSGFQIVGHNINPNSSSNYCVNNIYFAIDNHNNIKENCMDSLSFLNAGLPLLIKVGEKFHFIHINRTVLNDLSSHESNLYNNKKKSLCFDCDCDSETPICKYEEVTLHGVTLKWWSSYDLKDNIEVYHTESLLTKIPLWYLKLDWGFHGYKRLMNNLLKAVYDGWLSSKSNKQPTKLLEEETRFNSRMRRYVNPKYRSISSFFMLTFLLIHVNTTTS